MKRFLLQSLLVVATLLVNSCSTKETPRPAPKASFSWSNAGEGIVQFSDQSTEADAYRWNFGDGSSTNTEKKPQHTFSKNGKYVVSLTVTNPTASDQVVQEIDVSSFVSPIANFTVSYGDDGSVNFTNTSSGAMTYAWDFGNGTKSTFESPSVKYAENRKYTVVLTVTGKGGDGKITKELEVTNVKPVVDFSWTESNGQVTFTNKSKNADSYTWDFGNGKTSSEPNPVNRYTKTGSYTVKLIAKGQGGETTKTSTVSISYIALTLADVVDDPSLVNFLPGVWGAYVDGEGYKFNNYTYEFTKSNNTMKYQRSYNDYVTLLSLESTKLDYKFSVTNNVIYSESSGKSEKYARFQIISEDEMKFFQIFETATSYRELTPYILTRTSDVEKSMSSVVSSPALLTILKGVWDQGSYSIYTDVAFDFSAARNYYNYNSTFQEAKSIDKHEFKVDANNIMSYRRWNSDFNPLWKKYKVEIVSSTAIKLYSIDATGKVSSKPEYSLSKRN